MFTEDEHSDSRDDERASRWSWLDRPWIWPLFGLIAVFVFELTANPGLAVAFFCAKLGLRDLRLGWWMRNRDHDRQRGTTTGMIAASMIGLKVTMTSLVILIVLMLVWAVAPFPWNVGPALAQSAVSLGITTAASLCLSLLISSYGFALALWTGHKVWLESGMVRAPLSDQWPPECEGPPQRNAAIDIAQLGFVLQIPLILFSSTWLHQCLVPLFPGITPWMIVGTFVIFVASYIYLRLLISRVVARHPGECWPELTESGRYVYFGDMARVRQNRRRETHFEGESDDHDWD